MRRVHADEHRLEAFGPLVIWAIQIKAMFSRNRKLRKYIYIFYLEADISRFNG